MFTMMFNNLLKCTLYTLKYSVACATQSCFLLGWGGICFAHVAGNGNVFQSAIPIRKPRLFKLRKFDPSKLLSSWPVDNDGQGKSHDFLTPDS